MENVRPGECWRCLIDELGVASSPERHAPSSAKRGPTSRQRRISQNGKLLRVHPVKHDPIKAHGAFANPGGKPDRINAAS